MIRKDADMKMHRSHPNKQAGSMLLEGLISILLFSIGILAIVGLQAASIKMVGDAKYRSDASLLSDQLIGQMWSHAQGTPCTPGFAGTGTPGLQQSDFSSNPAGPLYTNWVNSVNASLPGVSGVTANQPTVTFTTNALTCTPSSIATITIYWNSPNEPAQAHKHVVVAEII
jgi:type IV pilus assembly protein PilV